MFVREPSLLHLTASPDDVLTLLTSLNKPMVALEDQPMDEGEATIWSVRRESDMVSTYIHLSLTGKKIAVFYRYEVDPYPDDLRGMVEGEALGFAESMGFIMDNTHYAELDAEERKQHIERGPFEHAGIEDAGGPPVRGGTEAVAREGGADAAGRGEQETFAVPGGAVARELPSDQEVDGAMRALAGAVPLEGGAEEGIDDELERAVEEFISGDAAGRAAGSADVPGTEPLTGPREAAPPATRGKAPFQGELSRFRRRKAGGDIYEIRGRKAGAGRPGGAAEAAAPGGTSAPIEPVQAPALVPADALSPGAAAGDPETRARRARARFLASF